MAENLNPSSSRSMNYGATASRVIDLPDVTFSPTEFMQLSGNIAQHIRAINSSYIQIEKTLKANKPKKYAQEHNQNKIHSIHLETKEHIDLASRDLQRLSAIVIRGDKQQKLQLDKLKKDFGNIVENYSQSQKQLAAVMKQAIMTQTERNALSEDAEQQENLIQTQAQVQAQLEFENSLLEERERQIKQIENDILDVNSIMIKISAQVHEQGAVVDRIEDRVEDAAVEVELGRSELEKADAYRRSYRRKVLIIIIIAVIVGIIVTGIIVGNITK